MKHGSLFSGIGGFDLAAEWMGWENVFHCEIDKYCQKILKKNFPGVELYEDIKQTDFTIWRGKINVLTGGFPCQPYSQAGKRKGKEDDRHLWPEMLRAIGEIQPRWIVGENVFGIVNWSRGLVFDEVQADLENEGYEVTPYILPACAKNALHRRDRVWFVAYAISRRKWELQTTLGRENDKEVRSKNTFGFEGNVSNGITTDTSEQGRKEWKHNEGRKDEKEDRTGMEFRIERSSENAAATNTDGSIGCESGLHKTESKEAERHVSAFDSRNDWRNWENFPTQSPVCGRNDGIPNRVDRIKALGNAVVPQVVYEIFKAIEQYEGRSL